MIFQIFIRGIIPFVIMSSIAAFLYYDGQFGPASDTFLTGIIITIVSGASVIYDLDQISLPKRSLLHVAAMVITVYPILVFSGWFNTSSFVDYVLIFIIFLITGAVLWSIAFIVIKLFSMRKDR